MGIRDSPLDEGAALKALEARIAALEAANPLQRATVDDGGQVRVAPGGHLEVQGTNQFVDVNASSDVNAGRDFDAGRDVKVGRTITAGGEVVAQSTIKSESSVIARKDLFVGATGASPGAAKVTFYGIDQVSAASGLRALAVTPAGLVVSVPFPTGGSGGGSSGTGSGLTNPGSLTATAVDGTVYNFGWRQLENAVQILRTAMPIAGVTDRVLRITLMTAVVESVLWRYANTSTYPESAFIEHDRDGYDHDSLGLFQQRPQSGWGSVAQLMDTAYATRAFIGGPSGPNNGSPPGLFDLNWQGLSDGAAAQAVQVSAHPGRYANVGPVADALLDALIVDNGLVYPFPLGDSPLYGGYRYGPRESPGGIGSTYHEGLDFPKPAGTPVPSSGAGTVDFAGWHGQYTWGNLVIINHGGGVRTWYAHLSSVAVSTGQTVAQGQTIGGVGTTGPSTGNHLHWAIEVNGSFIDPETYIV